MITKAIFIDKDGTLIENIPYSFNPDEIVLSKGVGNGLRLLKKYEYDFYVVSNQSGIARGLGTMSQLAVINLTINQLLAPYHVSIKDFYYCPHDISGGCLCRKPKPGLITKAVQEYGINLSESWIIGDILNDIEAGKRAGCKSILIDNGNETEWYVTESRFPDYIASDFYKASSYIGLSSKFTPQIYEK